MPPPLPPPLPPELPSPCAVTSTTSCILCGLSSRSAIFFPASPALCVCASRKGPKGGHSMLLPSRKRRTHPVHPPFLLIISVPAFAPHVLTSGPAHPCPNVIPRLDRKQSGPRCWLRALRAALNTAASTMSSSSEPTTSSGTRPLRWRSMRARSSGRYDSSLRQAWQKQHRQWLVYIASTRRGGSSSRQQQRQ